MKVGRFVAPLLLAALLGIAIGAPASADDRTQAATKVTLKVVDEHGWVLKGVEVASSYSGHRCEEPWSEDPDEEPFCYDSELYASAETNANGTATLEFALSARTTVNLVLNDDLYRWVPANYTVPVENLEPGATRDLGTITFPMLAKPGKAKTAINTSSKAAVKKAYQSQYKAQVKKEKPVKVTGCTVAKTPTALQKRELTAVNFFRSMVGVEKVKLDPKLSSKATKAAVIQLKQRYLSHYPAKGKGKCWTKTGYTASQRSNLSSGLMGAQNMKGYIDDPGFNNTAAGHRAWLLAPTLSKIGTGYAGTYNALWVFNDGDMDRDASSPTWISWPTAGYFPTQLEPYGRWSFSSPRSDIDLIKAKVKVTSGGKTVKQKVVYRDAGGVVFDIAKLPKAATKGGSVKVTISGMKLRGSTMPSYTYTIKFFRA